jgi:hypothetical protein
MARSRPLNPSSARGVEQGRAAGEVVIRSGMGDAGGPVQLPQGQGGETLGGHQAPGGFEQGATEVAVVIGALGDWGVRLGGPGMDQGQSLQKKD